MSDITPIPDPAVEPTTEPAVAADPIPAAAGASPTPPAAAVDQAAEIAVLREQIAQLLETATQPAPADTKPSRPVPSLNDYVTYTYEAHTGLPVTKRGVVVEVDEDNRRVLVNWLPDAVAELPVDALDA